MDPLIIFLGAFVSALIGAAIGSFSMVSWIMNRNAVEVSKLKADLKAAWKTNQRTEIDFDVFWRAVLKLISEFEASEEKLVEDGAPTTISTALLEKLRGGIFTIRDQSTWHRAESTIDKAMAEGRL